MALRTKGSDPLVSPRSSWCCCFGFKIAAGALPFLAPDAYERCPHPPPPLSLRAQSVASFFVLARLLQPACLTQRQWCMEAFVPGWMQLWPFSPPPRWSSATWPHFAQSGLRLSACSPSRTAGIACSAVLGQSPGRRPSPPLLRDHLCADAGWFVRPGSRRRARHPDDSMNPPGGLSRSSPCWQDA